MADPFPYKVRVFKRDLTAVDVNHPSDFQACFGNFIVWCDHEEYGGCFKVPLEEFSHAQILPIDIE